MLTIGMEDATDGELQLIVAESQDVNQVRNAAIELSVRTTNRYTMSLGNALSRTHIDELIEGTINAIREELPDTYANYSSDTRRFISRYDGMWHTFDESIIRVMLRNTIALHHNNIDATLSTIERYMNTGQPNSRTYMVSLYDDDESKAYGSGYDKLENMLNSLAEEYDGKFTFNKILIRQVLRNSTNAISRLNMHAGSGEGIPIRLRGGYWIMDYLQTKKYCLVAAVVAWRHYTRGMLHTNLEMYKKEVKDIVRKLNLKNTSICTRELCRLTNSKCMVLMNPDIVDNMDPSETLDEMVLHVSCNHAALVVHESLLSKDVIQWLEYRSRCTFVSLIRTKVVKPNVKQPSTMYSIDIECYRDKSELPHISHIPVLCGIYTGNGYLVSKDITCIDSLINYMLTNTPSGKSIVWAHYSGGYDNHILLKHIVQYLSNSLDNPLDITDANGALITLSLKHKDKHIVFRDSYRFFPQALSYISRKLGIGEKDDFDVTNATPDEICSDAGVAYNAKDCTLVYNIMSILRDEMLSKGWDDPLEFGTLSSYVKHMFLIKYYDHVKTPLYTVPKWLDTKIRMGYGGGTNNLYYRGVVPGPLYCYDANAMYVSVGRNLLPCGRAMHIMRNNIVLTREFLDLNFGFHIVTIVSSPTHCKPLHGSMINNKYMFAYFYNTPNQMIFSEELKLGLSLGYMYTVQESVTYDSAPLLKQLFTDVYNYRVSSTREATRQSWKLIGNSGYGFFGFNKYDRSALVVYGAEYEETLIHRHYMGQSIHTEVAPGIYMASETRNVLLKDTCVAVAAAITSYGRMELYNIQSDVQKYSQPIYVDTDSVFTTVNMDAIPELYNKYRTPQDGSDLGKMKDEYPNDVIVEAVFLTNKMYGLKHATGNYTIKLKGYDTTKTVDEDGTISRQVNKAEIYERMKRCLTTGEPMVFTTSTIFKNRASKISRDEYLYEKVHDMEASGVYSKGHVLADGSIIPFIVDGGVIVSSV